jgi:YHS domain-containing protein
MKTLKQITAAILVASFLVPISALADEKKAEKLKPYTLKTCLVTDEKLGEMGSPYVYEYKGREIKFCCKGCLKDFKKSPEKYIKKLEEAEAKASKNKS